MRDLGEKGAELRLNFPIILSAIPTSSFNDLEKREAFSIAIRKIALANPDMVDESVRITALAEMRMLAKFDEIRAEIDASVEQALKPIQQGHKLKKFIDELNNEIIGWRGRATQALQDMERTKLDAVEAINNSVGETKAKVLEVQDASLIAIENLREAQKELTTIAPAVELWRSKAGGHSAGFYIGTLIFVLGLGASAAVAVVYGGSYAARVVSSVSGHEILGTALIAAPLLAAAWLLRLISRFTLINLSLWQDANQRRAIAQFYLGLLSEERAAITKEERALALAALFRPTPGSGTDDIAPPSFLDLLKSKSADQ